MEVVVLISRLREGHEVAPRELHETRIRLKRQPRFGERCTGERIDGVRGHNFVNGAVGVKSDGVVRQREGVAVAGARCNAEVAQRHASTRVGIHGDRDACGSTARPQRNTLVQFNVQAINGVEHRGIVVHNVEVHDVHRCARRGVGGFHHESEHHPVPAERILVRPCHGGVGEQIVQRSFQVHGLGEHLLHQGRAVGHVAQGHGLGAGHQGELEPFERVAVGPE